MSENNKENMLYFSHETMTGLHQEMDAWQKEHQKRLLSLNIQKDGGKFCCIALTNPSEVIIVSGPGNDQATVTRGQLEAIMWGAHGDSFIPVNVSAAGQLLVTEKK